MSSLLCQTLKVPCLIHGISPILTEKIKPVAEAIIEETPSTCCQKVFSLFKRIVARVSTAINPSYSDSLKISPKAFLPSQVRHFLVDREILFKFRIERNASTSS